jgi:hypothetical protein
MYSTGGDFTTTISIQANDGSPVYLDPPSTGSITAGGTMSQATEGAAFNGGVAWFTDSNASANAKNSKAAIDWGDGQSSSGTVVADGQGGFLVQGAHTFADEGPAFITVTITDVGGTQSTMVSVANVADAPVAASGLTARPTARVSFKGTVATFTDGDPFAPPKDFTAAIDWGDGQSASGTILQDGPGAFHVQGTHTYAKEQQSKITVLVHDGGGAGATTTSTANVADAPLSPAGLTIQPTAVAAFQGPVASFTDADPTAAAKDFTAAINWGDGQSSSGTVLQDGTGAFHVQGSHTYAKEGSFKVTVTVHDVGGAVATATTGAVVADAPLTAHGAAVQPTAGVVFQGTVASFMDADPTASSADFTATLAWGDGQSSGGTIVQDGAGAFHVQGSHTYAREGHYTVAVTLHDVGGATTGVPSGATVADAPLTPTSQVVQATAGAAFESTVASFSDADPTATPRDFTASIDWGDGQSSAGTVVAANGGFAIQGSHRYGTEGVYTIAVHLSDAGGSSAAATSTAHVARTGPPPSLLTPVAAAIANSPEYYTNLIVPAYKKYLGRTPAQSEINYWLDQFANHGLTDQRLEARFIGATEYMGHYANSHDWIVAMYQDLLGRTPAAMEVSYWLNQLAQGEQPSDVAYGFAASKERDGQHVMADYQHYLGRTPAQSEVDYWVDRMINAGWTNEQVIAGFVGSAESFQQHYSNAIDWLDMAYPLLLGRPPDAGGLQNWAPVLEQS